MLSNKGPLCVHSRRLLPHGSFTLPNINTQTNTDTDKMCVDPNGNLHQSLSLSQQYEHLHYIPYKPLFIGLDHCWCKHTIKSQGV